MDVVIALIYIKNRHVLLEIGAKQTYCHEKLLILRAKFAERAEKS